MAILKPDKTTTLGGVPVHEYLLTKHNPNRIDMPSASMEGKIIGVTIHNTSWITTASRTTPAEQYTRATVNGNMNDVRVHYYVDNVCAWQNLPLNLSGWHAADGSGNGNRRTIAIECIMSSAYNSTDKKSEDNAARLAAALLKKYNLSIDHLYTHTHWLNVRDGKSGSVDYLNTAKNPYKMCPLYILPHWTAFKKKVQSYMRILTVLHQQIQRPNNFTEYVKAGLMLKVRLVHFLLWRMRKSLVNRDILCSMQMVILFILSKNLLMKSPVRSFRVSGAMVLTARIDSQMLDMITMRCRNV